MATPNESQNDTTTLLTSLLERFDSLEREVKTLKEKEARQSASPNPSEAETSKKGHEEVHEPHTAPEGNAEQHDRHRRCRSVADSSRRRTPSSSSDDGTSRSRSRSRSRPSRHRWRNRKQRSAENNSESSESCSPPGRKRSRKGKSPIRDGARNTRRSWADRMSDPEEEAMDYSKEVEFSDSGTEDQSRPTKIMEVSERTGKFLQESCTRRVPNSERRVLRDKYPLPKVPATRPAQLDHMMRSETSATPKQQTNSL